MDLFLTMLCILILMIIIVSVMVILGISIGSIVDILLIIAGIITAALI